MTRGASGCRQHDGLADQEVVVEHLEERREEARCSGLVDGGRGNNAVGVDERGDGSLEALAEVLGRERRGKLGQQLA